MIIYITKDNEIKLREHKDTGGSMSGLINKLLDRYFLENVIDIHTVKTVLPPASKVDISPKKIIEHSESNMVVDMSTVGGGAVLEPRGKLCKNGHAIPEGRSKCLGKGCKYA